MMIMMMMIMITSDGDDLYDRFDIDNILEGESMAIKMFVHRNLGGDKNLILHILIRTFFGFP